MRVDCTCLLGFGRRRQLEDGSLGGRDRRIGTNIVCSVCVCSKSRVNRILVCTKIMINLIPCMHIPLAGYSYYYKEGDSSTVQ